MIPINNILHSSTVFPHISMSANISPSSSYCISSIRNPSETKLLPESNNKNLRMNINMTKITHVMSWKWNFLQFNPPKTAKTKSHDPLELSIIEEEIKGPSEETSKIHLIRIVYKWQVTAKTIFKLMWWLINETSCWQWKKLYIAPLSSNGSASESGS